jgi:predicted RND superfamily exporter protein
MILISGEKTMHWVLKRPILTILLSLIVLAVCATGATRLSINSDTRVFFSESNENRQDFNRFESRYGSKTNLLITFYAAEGDVFTPERLKLIHQFTEDAWQIPYSTRVDSIANAIQIFSTEDDIFISEMITSDNTEESELLREQVMSDTYLINRLISADAKAVGINVTTQYPMSSTTATREILDAAAEMVETLEVEAAGLEVWYGGRVASSNAFSTASKNDLRTLTLTSYIAIILLTGILLRSAWTAVALFLTIVSAVAGALGIAGWLGFQINAATSFAPTAIFAIGIAAFLHLSTTFLEKLHEGEDQLAAMKDTLDHEAFPIFLSLLTTAIGFLTLNWADAPPFQELGTIVAIGCVLALFFGFTILPALSVLLPSGDKHPTAHLSHLKDQISDFVVAHWRPLVVTLPIGLFAIMLGIFKIEIDDNLIHYFDKSYEFRTDADSIQQHLTGLDVVEFDIGGQGPDAILDPAYFKKIEAFEAWLHEQPNVYFVASVAETFRRLNQHLNGGEPSFHRIPESRDEIAQYLLLYEMSLPLGRSLNDTITLDRQSSRVTAILRNSSTKQTRDLKLRSEAWLNETSPAEYSGVATGLSVMYGFLSSLNIKSMVGGSIVALIIISIIFIGTFKSLRYGAISLIPNLLPVAVAFGVWGFFVGKVGVAASTVGAATLGVIVDDTVHLMWRYIEARREGADAHKAVESMFKNAGLAMFTSSLVLMVGFMILATSGFHITSAMGALFTITVFFALVADWFILPPLLIALDRDRPSGPQHSNP